MIIVISNFWSIDQKVDMRIAYARCQITTMPNHRDIGFVHVLLIRLNQCRHALASAVNHG